MLVCDILMVKKNYFNALFLRFIFFVFNFFILFNVFSTKSSFCLNFRMSICKTDVHFHFVTFGFLKYVFKNLFLFGFLGSKVLIAYTSNFYDFLLVLNKSNFNLYFLPYALLFNNYLFKPVNNFTNFFLKLYNEFGIYNYFFFSFCFKIFNFFNMIYDNLLKLKLFCYLLFVNFFPCFCISLTFLFFSFLKRFISISLLV